jgi:O-6-methylguanine DNA methyltransferase
MRVEYSHYESPLGRLTLVVSPRGLCVLGFGEFWDPRRGSQERTVGPISGRQAMPPRDVELALHAYFAGELTALDALEVDPAGTPFQRKVWSALRRVPPGRTTSYAALAEQVGCRGGARAVGAANAANPVALVIPCHRVIRADGGLGGYGGGAERKEWLLRHEGVRIQVQGAACGLASTSRQAASGSPSQLLNK